jgi:hypothetical protein
MVAYLKNNQSKKGLAAFSSDSVPAWKVEGPVFNPQLKDKTKPENEPSVVCSLFVFE